MHRTTTLGSAWLACVIHLGVSAVFMAAGLADDAAPRTLKDIALRDLRTTLKGYAGDWQPDTGRAQGVPEPPRQKPVAADAVRIPLSTLEDGTDVSLSTALRSRRSCRDFTSEPLARHELGFLLWSAQGVTSPAAGLRTAPSAGGRFPLETYVLALRVNGVPAGIHRYLPESHELATVRRRIDLEAAVVEACYGQAFVGQAAAVIAWTTVPERTEWKYGYLSHRMIAIEAGHVCQNVCLATGAIGAGACPLLGYDQTRMDRLLEVDGHSEFTLYLAVVGKVDE